MDFSVILFFILLIAFAIALIAFKLINKKYTNFIINNSISLKRLLEINEKYKFFKCGNYNKSHTYDNEIFYDNISCQDYLIYQLQFEKNNVLKDIKNVDYNKNNYNLYHKEVELIKTFGYFSNPTEKFNQKYLFFLERKIFNKNELNPIINFNILITLHCSKINGVVYRSKHQTFDTEQILILIEKLNNKNGNFYRDKDIWDAICRVERGKVSNKMRFSIYKRDGYRCCNCGRSGRFNDLEIDHIKPIAKGGKTIYSNLQTLCRRCNKEKGDKY